MVETAKELEMTLQKMEGIELKDARITVADDKFTDIGFNKAL